MGRMKYRHRQRLKHILNICCLCSTCLFILLGWRFFGNKNVDKSILPIYWMSADAEFQQDIDYMLRNTKAKNVLPILVKTNNIFQVINVAF